jgi:Fic family protein
MNAAAIESVDWIEPARLEDAGEEVMNAVAELSAKASRLGEALHPRTAANLASLVRMMNCYYSNLIEGHNTRPRDIERALAGKLAAEKDRRNLQLEAVAHVRVQAEIDRMQEEGRLPEPASADFIRWLHREFYRDAPEQMLRIEGAGKSFLMEPGEWRSRAEHDVAVGRHVPPSSDRVPDFMRHFEERYRVARMGMGARILAMAAAHHRLNYIHPFPDGNGRVSRLMSHAMGLAAGIGAHGLWSISRGLARGLERPTDYKRMMDHADTPRQGDLDGRGNLSLRALTEFVVWFLRVCFDQADFMSSLFDLSTLSERLRAYARQADMPAPAGRLLEQALMRGEIARGDVADILGLSERQARRILGRLIQDGLLASDTPKTAVSLRFPTRSLETLFPRLWPEA